MKVCLFGSYIKEQMNDLLIKKLEIQNIEIVECNEEIHSIGSFFSAYLKLILKHQKIEYDIMILPLWRSLMTMPLAKIISRKPILYYGYMPIYDTLVNDRKIVKANSLKAKIIYLAEKMCCRFSNMIIKESYAEIDYFSKQYKMDKKKFRRLLISADDSKVPACAFKEPQQSFVVLYIGSFIPHHGTDIIIKAAKILSDNNDIIFKFCGDGVTKSATEELTRKYKLKNVKFLGWLPFKEMLKKIDQSDVCLGIFGDISKASYGVTNKNYQILCSQKPLITRESPAMKEINAENGKNCILIPPNNPDKLAEGILYLKNNVGKRKEISIAGRKKFVDELSIEVTSIHLVNYLNELLKGR